MVDRSRQIKYTDEQVIAAYNEHKSSSKAALALGIGQTTLLRVLDKHAVPRVGLTRYYDSRRVFDTTFGAELAEKYKAGAWVADLASEYGQSDYSVRSALKRAGCELRINPAPTIKDGELEKALKLRVSGLSQTKIALALGRSQSFVTRMFRNHGIPQRDLRREAHGKWNGGRMKAGAYWRVQVENTDPMYVMANNAGYVLEHRLVMARAVGRPLTAHETVHHINGDCADNRIENLQLRFGRHGKSVAMCCADCGSHNVGYTLLKGEVH